MKRLLVIMGVFAAGLMVAADAKDDPVKKELEKFNGVWKAVSIEHDGKEVPKEDLEKVSLTVKGDEYTFHRGDDVIKGTHKLDPTKTPKTIDAVRTEGPDKDKPLLGIYELSDDMYKVCFAAPGKERPTEFSSKEGSGHRLIVMKRAKP
jgi:uncharacterized protein (TIGR03067 family)